DTLQRHEASYHAQGPNGGCKRAYRIGVSKFRACLKCAAARLRCSGGTPCERCRSRKLQCEYPEKRKSRIRAMREAAKASSAATAKEQRETNQLIEGTGENAAPSFAGQPQPRFESLDSSSMSPIGGQPLDFINQGVSQTMHPALPTLMEHDLESATISPISPIRDQNYLDISHQPLNPISSDHNVAMPLHVRLDPPPEKYGYENENSPLRINTSMHLALSNPTSNPIQTNCDPTLFDQSVPSAMNRFPTKLSDSVSDAWPAASHLRSSWMSLTANKDKSLSSRVSDDVLQDSINLVSAQMRNNTDQYASEDSSHTGEYFSGGDDAHLPKSKPRYTNWSKTSHGQTSELAYMQNGLQNSCLDFLYDYHIPMNINHSGVCQPRNEINRSTYDKILESFNQTCSRNDISIFPKLDFDFFPPLDVLTEFFRLYFHFFQPVYPIFHVPTFDPNQCHWILTLAIAAIGCHFVKFAEYEKCVRGMHEFLRRVIFIESEISAFNVTPEWLVQATVLNCVGMLYSGKDNLKQSAMKSFSNLPLLSLEGTETQAPLPCQDDLWAANSEERWWDLYSKNTSDVPSLYSAIQELYLEKRLVSNIDEWGHVLLAHAIYHRTWEVAEYLRRPLSSWTPAGTDARDIAVSYDSSWLPAVSTYSKWRNSACDCLDLLHWTANATIAKACGLEHPTVLQLHAARIILLVPYKELRTLATSVALETVQWVDHGTCDEWQYIWYWAKNDQHKARLSILHSGSILWHVRRYSTNIFHEPMLVFLATLTLWAYGYCTRALKQQHEETVDKSQKSASESSTRLPTNPTFIHLDRPSDDELTQLFIREGHMMEGYITGVGDICGPSGPEQVLRVGASILDGCVNWGIARDLNIILKNLADQMSTSPVSNQSSMNGEGTGDWLNGMV
ncbi:hypothetical protein FQN54_008937, partial [Arachnomyces sp. PD_36]